MKFLVVLLCFLWASGVQAKLHISEPEIPKVNEIINWIPEEVPRTVSFYIDIDGDALVDVIVTYSLIEAYACRENCVYQIKDEGDHWLLPGNRYVYYVIKRWTLWKYIDDDDWRGEHKTNDFIYQHYDDWYNERYLQLWPEMAP